MPKARFSSDDWYDVWFPNLAPSVETMKLGQQAETAAQWSAFVRTYRAEMAERTGLSLDDLTGIEEGRLNASLSELDRIYDVLGYSWRQVVNGFE